MDDDFDLMDDWSETEEWDSSDTWDDADEQLGFDVHDDWLDEEEDHEEDLFEGGGGEGWGGGGASAPAQPEEGRRVGMSAWEFGTAAAVAGFLLDRQAERIAEAVRAQPPPGAGGTPTPAWKRFLPEPIDEDAQPLSPGDTLERSRLWATIQQRLTSGRQLGLEARPRPGVRTRDRSVDVGQLLVTIVVSELTPATPVWVMFEEATGGFSTARLQPVFDGSGPPGRAYCFVDTAEAAVDVVEYGLARYELALADFHWSGGL